VGAGARWYIFLNAAINLSDQRDVARVLTDAKRHAPDLIVFDSLAAMSGGIDENDSASMGRLAEALNTIKARTGAAILVLHHMTKEGWRPNEQPTMRHMRGHSSLHGRADQILAVMPIDELTNGQQLAFKVSPLKQRESAKALARSFVVDMGGPAATVRELSAEEDTPGKRRALRHESLKAEVLSLMPVEGAGQPISKTMLREKLGKRDVDVAAAVEALVAEGVVRQLGRGQYVRCAPPVRGAAREDYVPLDASVSSHPLRGEDRTALPEESRPQIADPEPAVVADHGGAALVEWLATHEAGAA
jgi:hypothetical protein